MTETWKHNEVLWNEIQKHDLSLVTKTFAERNLLYAKDAAVLELECRRFMYLAALAPELELAPTKPIDDYWHQFIHFTENYRGFCTKYTGYFVDHNPLAGPNHKMVFDRTQEMVTHLFGDFENSSWWYLPMPATSCKCTSPNVMSEETKRELFFAV